MRRPTALLIVLAIAAAGCGDGGILGERGERAASNVGADTRYQVSATVLESPDHGPQLCLGVNFSYPPQCSGLDLIGWDWASVDDAESAGGTTWGEYTVVGTWDGGALTVIEPPRPPDWSAWLPDEEDRFASPCPTPRNGWQVVDEEKVTDEAMNRAINHARSQPAVGGVWLDQSINPAAGAEPIDESVMNDPTKLVLNLSFTGDLERHEAAVREIWGGALCVSEAPASARELANIRSEIESSAGPFQWSSIDETTGRIEVGVWLDEGLQKQFDERYGVGVVDVQPALKPIED